MKKMHVMHITDTLAAGGKERILVDLANQTKLMGHQASVCVTREGVDLEPALIPGIACEVLGRKGRFDSEGFRKFIVVVQQYQPDIFHVHGRNSFAFIAFLRLLRKISQPIILHDHHGLIELDQSVPVGFSLLAQKYANYFVAVYDKLGDWAISRAGLSHQKVKVIPNTLDLERIFKAEPLNIHQELHLPEGMPLGLVACGIRKEKGIDVLIRAVAKSNRGSKMKILVIGNINDWGYGQYCRKLCEEFDLAETILFLGPRLNIPEWIKAADFAVMPSISESGPLVLIEYLAAGLPVIYSHVGDIGKRLTQFNIEGSIAPGDANAMANALDKIIQSSVTERRDRGAKGIDIAKEYFDIKKTMPQWFELYESLLK